MQKRLSRVKRKKKKRKASQAEPDVNQTAFSLVNRSTGDDTPPATKAQIHGIMAAMGRKGGKIGGKRSLETMTNEERSKRGLKAAHARWTKR
jgi:hypothetical protein